MKDDLIPLRDILKEIEFLHSVRDRTTFESFKASSSDVRAASYSIMVISEAVRRISGILTARIEARCSPLEPISPHDISK